MLTKNTLIIVAIMALSTATFAQSVVFEDGFKGENLNEAWTLNSANDENYVVDEGSFLVLTEAASGGAFPNTLELSKELPGSFVMEFDVTFSMNPPTPTDDDGAKQTFNITLGQSNGTAVAFDYSLWRAWNGYHVGAGYSLTKKGKTSRRPQGNIHIGNHAVQHEVTLKVRIEKKKHSISCTATRTVNGGKAQKLDLGFYKILKFKPTLRIGAGNQDAEWPSAEMKVRDVKITSAAKVS